MAISIVRTLPQADWQRFVDGHPQSNIFHTPQMFQAFGRAKSYRPELWAAVDGAGRILALLTPVQVDLGGRLPRFLTTRAIAYGGLLYEHSSLGEQGLACLLQAYTEAVEPVVLFTELRNQNDLSDTQPILQRSGFVYEDHLNFLIPLRGSAEDLLQRIGSRTRKHIRRGLRKNQVIIREGTGREDVRQCYEILQQTYAAARVPLADRSLFEAVFDLLHPLGMVKFLTAWMEETCVAASVELVYKDTIYGWYGGVDRAYRAYAPNELLMWHILCWGAENGYQLYDFGGAGKPDAFHGIRDFKAKFGGELVCFGRNICLHAPRRLAVSKVGYEIYRRFMRQVQ